MDFFQFDPKLEGLVKEVEKENEERFCQINKTQKYNEQKVLKAFLDNRVSQSHFAGSTGYGYGDRGRDTLDQVFAQVFGTTGALVRHQFVSGTHALTVALFGVLRPGDLLLSASGTPYDTMESVIQGEGCGSLSDFGVLYKEVPLLSDGSLDKDSILSLAPKAKVLYLQRSRGYSLRPSISIYNMKEIINEVKRCCPNCIVLVDNCYGEFTELEEPSQIGADLVVGSLIKNPGGGIAKTGGYIVGEESLVELCAQRLTAPGVGKEAGCSLQETRDMFMGLFFAPSVVASARKTAVFASGLFSKMGYKVYGGTSKDDSDIITTIELGSEKALLSFCKGIQSGSPVDSFVEPIPWDMPGYSSKVIMAAGAFTEGASIELSADAPLCEPYPVYLQGGLTYETAKIGILKAAQNLMNLK